MLLQRTEKARIELLPGPRTLGLRERSLLMLADGNKSLMDLDPLFGGEGGQLVLSLVRQGYLEPLRANPARKTAPADPSSDERR
jgi:hypothetical protein